MDIVEAGALGARAAVVEMRARGGRCRFTLYPMLHIADPACYAEVSARLAAHDLIVVEGVGRSRPTSLLTLGYRMVGRRSRLGLQV